MNGTQPVMAFLQTLIQKGKAQKINIISPYIMHLSVYNWRYITIPAPSSKC